MNAEDLALYELGRALRAVDYRFVAVSRDTRARVNGRSDNGIARSLRDVFGWNRPFRPNILPRPMLELVRRANVVTETGGLYVARVRFATLAGALFVHSASPSEGVLASGAVTFGPDTYRFCRLLHDRAQAALRVVDVGCGAGAGGISLASVARHVVLADPRSEARRYAGVNAALAGAHGVEIVESVGLTNVDGPIDLVVANTCGAQASENENDELRSDSDSDAGDGESEGDLEIERDRERDSVIPRDGSLALGIEHAVAIVREALARLVPGGRLMLSANAATVDGRDMLLEAVEPVLALAQATYRYIELETDVAGSLLERAPYANVERVAAIALTAVKSGA